MSCGQQLKGCGLSGDRRRTKCSVHCCFSGVQEHSPDAEVSMVWVEAEKWIPIRYPGNAGSMAAFAPRPHTPPEGAKKEEQHCFPAGLEITHFCPHRMMFSGCFHITLQSQD